MVATSAKHTEHHQHICMAPIKLLNATPLSSEKTKINSQHDHI